VKILGLIFGVGKFEALLIAPSPLVVFKLPRSYSYSTPGLQ